MATSVKQTVAAMLVRAQEFGVFIDLVDGCRLEVTCAHESTAFDWTELVQKHRPAIVDLLRDNETEATMAIARVRATM